MGLSEDGGSETCDDAASGTGTSVTPPKEGERKCGLFKNKASGQQWETDAILQLQANMFLTCSKLLKEKMASAKTTADLQSINILTCYGMLMGPMYSLKLFKLIIDFEERKSIFEELFSFAPCTFYLVYVDT